VSHPIRTDSDRTRVLNNAATTVAHLLKIPHTVNDLRRAIDLQIDDGLRAASYDGRVRGGTKTPHPEAKALLGRGDRACDALTEFDKAVKQLNDAVDKLQALSVEFPTYDREARKGLKDREPGKGTAPSHLCQVCWAHGTERERYGGTGTWCPTCAGFQRTYGQRPTVRAVWEILHIRGHVPLSDLRRLWPEVARKVSA
jgi:hypothetical protein